MSVTLGFIGGSGLHSLQDDVSAKASQSETPQIDISLWGPPSAIPEIKPIGGHHAVFLNRHGKGHTIPPHQVNYRGNIAALKQAGVTDIIAFCAVGSLNVNLPPGTFVIVDQYIDRTKATRHNTFFEESGIVAHVSLAEPTCRRLNKAVLAAAQNVPDLDIRVGGTLVVIDGPQFSTRAESRVYQSWGADLVGMTTMTEARLAREAEICYTNIAMVTDFDCFDETRDPVSVDAVIQVMQRNGSMASQLTQAIVKYLDKTRQPCPAKCDKALSDAVCSTMPTDKNVLAKYRILNSSMF